MTEHARGIRKRQYMYTAFGLLFVSDVKLPEFCKGSAGNPDVKIILDDVPDKIQAPCKAGEDYQVSAREFLLHVDGVAGYYVTNGKEVIVQRYGKADMQEVRLFLLGTAMGVLLLQRGILPIHGSAVMINGCCVVFTGKSGVGKSTAAAALHKRGYALLADDIAAVQFDRQGLPWVRPGYPQQKLWRESVTMVGVDREKIRKLGKGIDKYAVPVHTGFAVRPVPLAAICELDANPGDDLTITQSKGMEKIAVVLNNIYRAELLDGLGLKATCFKKCANMIKHMPVFRLRRPQREISLGKQADMLERYFTQLIINKSKQCIIGQEKTGGWPL